jgi:hypothetical protein
VTLLSKNTNFVKFGGLLLLCDTAADAGFFQVEGSSLEQTFFFFYIWL